MDSADFDLAAQDEEENPVTVDEEPRPVYELTGQEETEDTVDEVDEVTQDRLYTETQNWDTLEELRGHEGKLCALAQNIPSSTHIHKMTIHFQSKKRSNGGSVKCIVKMPDGYLIVFEDEQDCKTCLERKGQKLGNNDIVIHPKQFPTLHRRKFLIKDASADTTTEKLVAFLKRCLKSEVALKSCGKLENSDDYVVEYKDEIDAVEIESFVQSVHSSRLNGAQLKVGRLHRSDCLRVVNLSEDVTIDQVQQAFQDIRCGVVTGIDLTGNKSALVYFTAFEDAEIIQEMWSESFSISGQHAAIELYYHTLSKDHEMVLESVCEPQDLPQLEKYLRPFQETTDKTSVVQFIHNSEKHHELLKNFYEDCATVEIAPPDGNKKSMINFIPKVVEISPGKSQKIFEGICIKNLQVFLSKYLSEKLEFTGDKLVRAKEKIDDVECNHPEFDDDIAFSLQSDGSTIEVVGLKENVDFVIQEIRCHVNRKAAILSINEEKYKILVLCGILIDVQRSHQNVKTTCNDDKSTVTVEGDEAEVDSFQIAALSALNEIESKNLTGFSEYVVKFLSESNETCTGRIKDQVQRELNSSSVQAVIGMDDGEVCVKYRATNYDQYQKAIDVIKRSISFDSIPLNEVLRNDVVKRSEWADFKEELCTEGLCAVFIEVDVKIVIVATTAALSKLKKEVENYLDQNTIDQIYMRMTFGEARYIMERFEEFAGDVSIKREFKCSWTGEDNELLVEAKRKILHNLKPEIAKLLETVAESPLEVEDLGMKEYFISEEGKQFLSTVEYEKNCVILMESEEIQSRSPSKRKKSTIFKKLTGKSQDEKYHGEEWTSRTLPNTTIVLKVCKTDVIRHRCDAIFCACDREMQILPNGTSGTIKKFDARNGGKIQAEISKACLMPGDVSISQAECLQSYKKVILVIVPRWDSHAGKNDPRLILKACISNGLKEAEKAKLKSVAIPAICCGERGPDASTCAALILESINDHFQENGRSSLKKLYFVEGSRQEVLHEFKKCVDENCLPGKKSGKPFARVLKSFRRKGTTCDTEIPLEVSNSKSHNSSPKLELLEGDILEQSVDVIVNVTDSDNLSHASGHRLWRTKNPPTFSQVLYKKLDTASQNEMKALNASECHRGKVLETNAGGISCKKLYHALVSFYNPPESLDHLCSVVAECLNMANVSGYQSIAFPTIATREYGHPPLLVAKLMRREISKFTGENPRTVTIVLDPADQAVVSAFQAEFNSIVTVPESLQALNFSLPSTYNSRGQEKGGTEVFSIILDDSTALFGRIVLSISRGNIPDQHCDLLVNVTNDSFDLKKGEISREILRKGGMQIQNEAISARKNEINYIETSGGELHCKKIIHIVEPKSSKDLVEKILEVFEVASKGKMSTVSFAEFGKVIAPSAVASVMRKVLKKVSTYHRLINTIFIVTRDEEVIAGFQKVFCTVKTEKTLFQRGRRVYKKTKEIVKGLTTSPSEDTNGKGEQTTDKLKLFIYAIKEDDIAKARECIFEKAERLLKTSVFQDNAICQFTSWEKYELQELAKMNKVTITDTSNRYLGRLTIKGFEEAIEKARQEIENIVQEFSNAETCANYVTWERRTEFCHWKTYHPRAAYILEKEYKMRKSGDDEASPDPILVPEFDSGDMAKCPVDLSEMDLDTPKIRRKTKEGADLDIPPFWEDMGDRQLVEVTLASSSQEYQNVLAKIQKGKNFYPSVKQIQRIQNLSLYKQYAAKRTEVKNKLENFGKPFGKRIEQQLFHGTSDDDKILVHGFDRSYAGKNATLYGKGVYFACNPGYSNAYATPNSQGERRMFLADVITGEYCVGRQDMAAPPSNRNSHVDNDVYDSAVDRLHDPSIYVIFKDASAYPTYRITYTA